MSNQSISFAVCYRRSYRYMFNDVLTLSLALYFYSLTFLLQKKNKCNTKSSEKHEKLNSVSLFSANDTFLLIIGRWTTKSLCFLNFSVSTLEGFILPGILIGRKCWKLPLLLISRDIKTFFAITTPISENSKIIPRVLN